MLREVVTERDRLLAEISELPLREQVAPLTATGEHLTMQLKETKEELKSAREETRGLQGDLLELARKGIRGTESDS